MSKDINLQRIIPLSCAAALGEYLERVRELGAMEGQIGFVEISPTLQPVLEAMHHVLSGGEVEVRVVRDGQPDLFRELQQRAALATAASNVLHPPSGTVLFTAV
jgi:hypothetical protein